MDSTKEFERMERLIEANENESIDHQSKKHKSFDESLELCSMNDSIEMRNSSHNSSYCPTEHNNDEFGDEPCNEESLEEIITKFMKENNVQLSEYDHVYNKVQNRIQHEKKFNTKHLSNDQCTALSDLEGIKDSLTEVTTLAKNRKRPVNDGTLSVNEDIEIARRALAQQSSSSSTMNMNHKDNGNNSSLFFDYQIPKNITLLPDTPQHNNNNNNQNQHFNDNDIAFDSNEKRMLLDQIKDLQDNYQKERQFYLEENEKLHTINEEYCNIIEDFRRKEAEIEREKKYSLSVTTTATTTTTNTMSNGPNSSLTAYMSDLGDSSSTKGLFDWPIDDAINGEIVLNERTYTPTNNRNLHVLSVYVKTFLDIENDIEKNLQTLGLESANNSTVDLKRTFDDSFFYQSFPSIEGGDNLSDLTGDGLLEDHLTNGSSSNNNNNSGLYYSTSNSSNQSHHSIIQQEKLNDMEEDVVLVTTKRLRNKVEKVLKHLSEFVERQSMEHCDLQAALENESICRDKLARQLIDKESLIVQLEKDKKTILEQTSDYFAIKNERDQFKAKAEEYERDRDKFREDVNKFQEEKQQFVKGLPQLQKKLSKENEILNKDLSQLQIERENLLQKVNQLTQEIETLKNEKESILEKKSAEFEDVLCQIESHEKNFNSMKKFIEEQTADRETEREEYNKEITSLQAKLKEYEKNDSKLSLNIKNLEDQVALFQEERNGKDGKIEEMEKQAQLSSVKISELNMNIKKLEKELQENQKVKELLRHQLKDVCQNLNLKTSERLNWEELLQVINNLVDLEKANLKLKNVQNKNLKVKFDVPDDSQNGGNESEDNSVFLTINLLNNKLETLKQELDSLIEKNKISATDLEKANEQIAKLEKIRLEKEQLEKVVFEYKKENHLLQEEINDNHLKYSELKVKVENSIDVQHFKRVVDELEDKLNGERSLNDSLKIKLEQTDRDFVDLEEKLNAHEKEIKSYKELVKSYENQQKNTLKDRNEIRDRYDGLKAQFNEANSQMLIKEKTIGILEQNLELLKNKLLSLQREKDVYLEKINSMDENQNQVIVYEKNMDKLRLQLKMAQDKVNYLDLEVKSLKKKIEIMERENEVLKFENSKIQRSKTDSSLASRNNELAVHELLLDNELNSNSIGNGNQNVNMLALKVRRLFGQKNALIFQKNYLLHILDSCKTNELDTLSVLDQLGQFKDFENFENNSSVLRGKSKFRVAVYSVIALQRMKWMAKLWQCRRQEYLIHRAAASLSPKIPFGNLHNSTTSRLAASSSSIGSNSSSSSSPSSTMNRLNFSKNGTTMADLNSTMKGFVDRLHNVHETLGLQTKKL